MFQTILHTGRFDSNSFQFFKSFFGKKTPESALGAKIQKDNLDHFGVIEIFCIEYLDINETSKVQEKVLEIGFQNEYSSSLGTFFVFVSFLLFHFTIFCLFRKPLLTPRESF